MHECYPKIWLYADGSGDETATWTVDVTYEGYKDSGFNVSGTIIIENTGDVEVEITDVSDLLAGTDISEIVDWGSITFPYTIAVGETITGTYSVDVESMITGQNMATATTSLQDGSGNYITFEGYADIVWGDPTTEVNETITVKDVSDLSDTETLYTVTAPNDAQFTYTKDFTWADYNNLGPSADYTYKNTATIVETGQSASATLKVNVQGYVYETAYAMGCEAVCFIPTFNNWGWTNPIKNAGIYTWDLWAGAAHCDTSKGTLVGSVTVVYSGGNVNVTYNVASPYILNETHVYAGTTQFPEVKLGKKTVYTVAPGQYYIEDNLGDIVYVIAHAVVGIPDPYLVRKRVSLDRHETSVKRNPQDETWGFSLYQTSHPMSGRATYWLWYCR